MIFFLPDPRAALGRWAGLLSPGGRLGLSTFGPQDATWGAVDRLFEPYLPPALLDARTTGARGPFASDAGVTQLLHDNGFSSVDVHVETLPVSFDDADAWRRWTMSVRQRQMWGFVLDEEKSRLFERATEMLAAARGPDGAINLCQDVRYTVGRMAALS